MKSFYVKAAAFIKKPEKAFLAVGLSFGLLLVLLVPPMQAPDELSHFFRAYQLSDGQLIADRYDLGVGGELPKSLKNMSYVFQAAGITARNGGEKVHPSLIKSYVRQPFEPQDKSSAQFTGAALYSPVPYVPQVVGIETGRVLHLSPLLMFYLARIVNLGMFLILCFFAIKLLPFGKWCLAAIALLPTTLAQAASLSADSVTNGLAFLTFSYFMYLYFTAKKITLRRTLTLGGLLVLLALSKQTFFVFALLPFILPVKKFANKKVYLYSCLAMLIVAVGLAAAWSRQVDDFIPAMAEAFRPGINVVPAEQLGHIITHPLWFPEVVIRTLLDVNGSIIISNLTMTEYNGMPMLLIGFSYFSVIAIMLASARQNMVLQSMRLRLLLITLAGILAIMGTLYLTYNSVEAGSIAGLQGRYFIPFLPVIAVIVMTGKWRLEIPARRRLWLYSMGVLVPLLGAVLIVTNLFYGFHI